MIFEDHLRLVRAIPAREQGLREAVESHRAQRILRRDSRGGERSADTRRHRCAIFANIRSRARLSVSVRVGAVSGTSRFVSAKVGCWVCRYQRSRGVAREVADLSLPAARRHSQGQKAECRCRSRLISEDRLRLGGAIPAREQGVRETVKLYRAQYILRRDSRGVERSTDPRRRGRAVFANIRPRARLSGRWGVGRGSGTGRFGSA